MTSENNSRPGGEHNKVHLDPRQGDTEEGDPDPKRKEAEIRDKAILHQQRRLKQATQFVHKDSADLLPLDQLKRLGTSKDLQPHSVVQRRLLEGNLSKLRDEHSDQTIRTQSPLVQSKEDEGEDSRKEPTALLIPCKCHNQDLRAVVNTGYQRNLISRSCVTRLGLEEVPEVRSEDPPLCFPYTYSIVGQVEHLKIHLGEERVECSALVVEDEMPDFCFGLQTLLSLRVRNFQISPSQV
ncbi:nuclear receptor-interacting protein 2 isoform X2 [Microcaecilia unicolor]|uniref:Nuclear receptor-interacting protein 2 isoform X2 n=1 Tax=Microcaecilia unicolor TaxID=1415580 RepID=A0A6P7Z316_9AMPH|nr:nuclear receptor-interacting protein 2 isoform X2 [Microcaecilia unicolor]